MHSLYSGSIRNQHSKTGSDDFRYHSHTAVRFTTTTITITELHTFSSIYFFFINAGRDDSSIRARENGTLNPLTGKAWCSGYDKWDIFKQT
jgi:hypothetical protein